MHPIDGFSVVTLLTGAGIGLIKGPFSTLVPLVANLLFYPLAMKFRPHVLEAFALQDPVYSLAYFPLFFLIVTGFSSLFGKFLDKKTAEFSKTLRHTLGFVSGATLASAMITLILGGSYPILIRHKPEWVADSKIVDLIESFYEKNPQIYSHISGLTDLSAIQPQNFSDPDSTFEKILPEEFHGQDSQVILQGLKKHGWDEKKLKELLEQYSQGDSPMASLPSVSMETISELFGKISSMNSKDE